MKYFSLQPHIQKIIVDIRHGANGIFLFFRCISSFEQMNILFQFPFEYHFHGKCAPTICCSHSVAIERDNDEPTDIYVFSVHNSHIQYMHTK